MTNLTPLSVTELARDFSDYINRVAYRQERFLLLRGRRPVAELRPALAGRPLGELPALLQSLPHLTAVEAEALAADIEAARGELSAQEMHDPWQS